MAFDLPIIAYDSTAVPDPLGGAGVLVHEKKVERVAELLDILVHSEILRESVIHGQRKRLAELQAEGREPFLLQMIDRLRGAKP